ncbi:DUF4363 family protein [Pseudoflavonifractor capillosus]|uniref:DUF4363 family protein n=1 Tax=Pseudoflavonifractor capillosus TaxID=106588 RepID=UPI00195E4D84|nr:DUF4363 family protein [Pseudoflavonifractor capillosus]MBM6896208.1 DUF4363 family protein [Pseudoflavonifractor capillosus]
MRRLVCSLLLLASLLGLTSLHVWYLTQQTRSLSLQLNQAQQQVEAGNWDEAFALTQRAWKHWENQMFYLHTTLHHDDIDQVSTAFQETLAILQQQEQPGEYAAANARILYQLELLVEAELPSLKNIL